MLHLRFPAPFAHERPPVRDVNAIALEHETLATRAADRVAAIVGSWTFIIIQSLLLVG